MTSSINYGLKEVAALVYCIYIILGHCYEGCIFRHRDFYHDPLLCKYIL